MSIAWTHMMAYDDVLKMVRLARDGMSVIDWRARAENDARLLSGDRRVTQLRYALTILRPSDGTIHDDGYLRDVLAANAEDARDLVYARYLAGVPLAVVVARTVLLPCLRRGEREVSRGVVTTLLDEHLGSQSADTRARSRSSLITEFSRAGIIRADRSGRRPLQLTGRIPSSAALLYLIRDDLRDRREATDAWLASESLAAAIFAVPANVMSERIEMLVTDGRLTRSYYSGEPRILAA